VRRVLGRHRVETPGISVGDTAQRSLLAQLQTEVVEVALSERFIETPHAAKRRPVDQPDASEVLKVANPPGVMIEKADLSSPAAHLRFIVGIDHRDAPLAPKGHRHRLGAALPRSHGGPPVVDQKDRAPGARRHRRVDLHGPVRERSVDGPEAPRAVIARNGAGLRAGVGDDHLEVHTPLGQETPHQGTETGGVDLIAQMNDGGDLFL
jgi:hypothetical protein